MQWSSPRASMGFKRLPASMAPSVLPAPHDGVEFVDEEEDFALRLLHLVEDGL